MWTTAGRWVGLLGVCGLAASAVAGDYRPPRTASGVPDLDGTWTNNSLTMLERPDELKTLVIPPSEARAWEAPRLGKPPELPDDNVGGAESEWWDTDVGLARIRGQARTSWIVQPTDGQRPFNAAAKAARKVRSERRKVDFDHPESRPAGERCLEAAAAPPLQNGGYNDNFQFVQTRDHIAIVSEYMGELRIVRLGETRHPPKAVRLRMGDSLGRWEGDTLVIETTNFPAEEVEAPDGDPQADMRVVERITRTSPTELHYAFRVENPAVYAQSWQGEMVFRALTQPTFEFACHEGNYSMPNILAGARQQEAVAMAPGATQPAAPAQGPAAAR
ncbi:hypothetical protein [Phenylobacterium sp.]|uniref:hypothetical protein n=1 Tax=Phenylobacterium sp. TaxID=1871053 RepID=UPI003982FEA5